MDIADILFPVTKIGYSTSASVEFAHCPSLLLTLFFKLPCGLGCQGIFFGPLAYIVLLEGLISFPLSLSQHAISPKPFCVLHSELSLLSCAAPLHKISTISPLLRLSPGTLSLLFFCPSYSLCVLALYTHRSISNDSDSDNSEVSQHGLVGSVSCLFGLFFGIIPQHQSKLTPTRLPPPPLILPNICSGPAICLLILLSACTCFNTHTHTAYWGFGGWGYIKKKKKNHTLQMQRVNSVAHCKLLHVLLNCSLSSPRVCSSHS